MSQAHPGRRLRGFAFASVSGLAGEKRFEAFDVGAADLREAGHVGVVFGEVDGEVPQRGVDQFDAARAHADGDLGQVSTQGFDQERRSDGEGLPMADAGRRRQAGRSGVVEGPEAAQGGFQTVQWGGPGGEDSAGRYRCGRRSAHRPPAGIACRVTPVVPIPVVAEIFASVRHWRPDLYVR